LCRANRRVFSDKDRQRRTVAVIGNGIIGHGVAQVFGTAGIGVVMIWPQPAAFVSLKGANEALENAIGEIRDAAYEPDTTLATLKRPIAPNPCDRAQR
jgi:3-hydroxyacyl-CoA dehydrogenase